MRHFRFCDASFRVLYVFVAMEVVSRRILHANGSASFLLSIIPAGSSSTTAMRFFYAPGLRVEGFGVLVLKTPVRAPKVNAYCERLVGTIRRESPDRVIPLSETRLKRILRELVITIVAGMLASVGSGILGPSDQ